MPTLIPRWIFAVTALAVLASSSAARATDPDAEARERYERAVKLYEDGAYDAALVELKRAAELRPSYKLFYNIAQVELAMNDYAAALTAYRKYLQEGGDRIQAGRRDAVQKEIDKLLQRVATLTIKTDVDGAEVFVDETLVGTTPLSAPLVVNAGIRRIAVRHPDYLPQSRQLGVTGGAQEKVSFSLVTTAPAASSAPGLAQSPAHDTSSAPPAMHNAPVSTSSSSSAKEQPEEGGSSHTLQWIGWGLTGALAIGASVTGALALSKNSSLSDKRNQPGVTQDELEAEASTVRSYAIATDALIVSAIAAGGVSLWLTLDSSGSPEKETAAHGRSTGSSFKFGMGLNGVRLRGTF